MVARCEVCGITKRTNSIDYDALKNISFHRFPLHRPQVLEKWILFVGRSDYSPKNYHRVCSVHFTDDSYQFRPKAENRLLKEDAVPTLYPFGTKQPKIPSSSSSSQPIKQEPMDTNSEPQTENMVIVSDRNNYKNVLNSYTDANRRIVVSDTSNLKDGSGSALAKVCQASATLSASIATFELIDVNSYKKDPLASCEDEFLTFRIKELEKVFKPLRLEKRRWQLKIRRSKVKFEKLRKEYFRCDVKKQGTLVSFVDISTPSPLSEKNGEKLFSLQLFPKDTKQRAEWVKAVRRADWTPSYCSALCSEHFEESDFDRSPFRTSLKPNAVPSIFKGLPKCLQEKPSARCNLATSSPPPKQGPSDETLASRSENAGSTNENAVDQNKPEDIRRKNDCNKNTVVIVSDTADYTKVLNGPSDEKRRIVVSDKLPKTKGPSSSALARMGNVGSTNNKVAPAISDHFKIDQKKVMVLVVPGSPAHEHLLKNSNLYENLRISDNSPAPKHLLNSNLLENRRISDNSPAPKHLLNSNLLENRRISDNPPAPKHLLNSNLLENRRISDRLIPNKRLHSSLSNAYQTSPSSAFPEDASEQTGKKRLKNDPLMLVDDGVLRQRIKELGEVVKSLLHKKKIWGQRIRRTKRNLKKLRNKYIRFNKKNPTIFHRTSQPVVHFLARDVQNE